MWTISLHNAQLPQPLFLLWKLWKQSLLSVQFSHSVVADSLRPHESQHARPSCPSPTPRVYSDSCPSSRWCHLAISSSVVPFSSCPQSLPASGSFPISQFFAWSGQSIGVSVSASVLPVNTQDWFSLGWTGCISFSLYCSVNHSILYRSREGVWVICNSVKSMIGVYPDSKMKSYFTKLFIHNQNTL